MARATLEKRPDDVARMFDAVAGRYDAMNAVMTFGQERRWRRIVAKVVAARPGMRVLDLAAGTGASAVPFAKSGATTIACDFSAGMLAEGRRRHPELTLVAGDALLLPFADRSFDAVTISFGLRNVARLDRAVEELARVTRPGGRIVVLETATPAARPVRAISRLYTSRVMPRLARLLSSDASSYAYLAESAGTWLSQPELAAALRAGGWQEVAWRDLMFGAVALHTARMPGGDSRPEGAPA
ncbi:MAG: demethylmenaquinone methyltransferase / 2-methoxy-6-polyprenyl,4-benzoquinol methylase [Frankiaceae bacterium]|jgi:demethylmenaquinone methyltransferase/2-methoxy-6-polyprenyl-1,4-benzoquinol methylase|nr:demethylmenaquinone methyltransferase / 2-methoxy-6-polyprenyl,4-benzoquinol methylase [Frankiaceae bacterium]